MHYNEKRMKMDEKSKKRFINDYPLAVQWSKKGRQNGGKCYYTYRMAILILLDK